MQLLAYDADAAPAGGGHLHAFTADGEPQLRDGAHYERADLVRPAADDERIIQIGDYGDCWLIAPYKACENSDAISVVQRGDKVTVTVAGGRYEMSATLPFTDDGEPLHAHGPPDANKAGYFANKAGYIEKAAAMHFGSYADLQAGYGGHALAWLVGGGEGRSDELSEFSDDFLIDLFGSGRPTTVGSPYFAAGTEEYELCVQYNLMPDLYHAYHVVGMTTTDDGRPAVQVGNSLMETQPLPMSLPVFRKLFTDLDWIKPDSSPEEGT
jgi:hypothetical protein